MIRQIQDLFYSFIPRTTYLRYGMGDTNVVISAPHGGGIKPYTIPPRRGGVQLRDTYSRTLTETIMEIMGEKPYYIISDIHRSRVDLNRDLKEAAEGNPKAKTIWHTWNNMLSFYTEDAKERNGKVLYVDIHSHDNNDTFQLGYNISADAYLDVYYGRRTREVSTMDSIPGDIYSKLFGPYSFKRSLELMGLRTFIPDGNEMYFNGGRNVETFNGNGTAAIQIEAPYTLLHTDLKRAARGIAFAIQSFQHKFMS